MSETQRHTRALMVGSAPNEDTTAPTGCRYGGDGWAWVVIAFVCVVPLGRTRS